MPRRPRLRHRTVVATAALAGTLALLGACGGSEEAKPLTTDQVEIGRAVYANHCAVCHGAEGQGGVGIKLADGFHATKYPDPAVTEQIVTDGRGAMPGWKGRLSEDEIDAVVRYVREVL